MIVKNFLKTTALFLLLVLSTLVLMDVGSDRVIRSKARFELKGQKSVAIFGYSHAECAYNDSLIARVVNLSESGESFFYTYQKIRVVLEQNPDIEVVMIEFSNSALYGKMDDWTWGDRYLSIRYPIYAPFMTARDQWKLASHNARGFSNSFSVALRKKIWRIQKSRYDYSEIIGGYKALKWSKTDSLIKAQERRPEGTMDSGRSEMNLHYLKKIVELGSAMGKKMYLVRSPLHAAYRSAVDDDEFQRVLVEHFPGINFLDFANFPAQNHQYADLEHLNETGALEFSIWFNQLIEKGLLNAIEPQEMIDKAMAE